MEQTKQNKNSPTNKYAEINGYTGDKNGGGNKNKRETYK